MLHVLHTHLDCTHTCSPSGAPQGNLAGAELLMHT